MPVNSSVSSQQFIYTHNVTFSGFIGQNKIDRALAPVIAALRIPDFTSASSALNTQFNGDFQSDKNAKILTRSFIERITAEAHIPEKSKLFAHAAILTALSSCPEPYKRHLNENGFFVERALSQFRTQRNSNNQPDHMFAFAASYFMGFSKEDYPRRERQTIELIETIYRNKDLDGLAQCTALKGLAYLPGRFKTRDIERVWDEALYFLEHHAKQPKDMAIWNSAAAVRELREIWNAPKDDQQAAGSFGTGTPFYLNDGRTGANARYEAALDDFRRAFQPRNGQG